MKKWAIVLHFYQPPVMDLGVTKQVLDSSYMPVLKMIERTDGVKITVNISACLLEQLQKLQKFEFFDLLRRLHHMGKIEFLTSPAYHPIAPLIQERTFARQMNETEWLYEDLLGFKPGRGLFLPELAVNTQVLGAVEGRYDYLLIDQSGLEMQEYQSHVRHGEVDCLVNHRYICDIIRSYPVAFSGKKLADFVYEHVSGEALMTVNDVEAFGHHYQERVNVLYEVMTDERFEICFVSELFKEPASATTIKPSSWQHVREQNDPFWLWSNPANLMQQAYWKLARTAQDACDEWGKKTEGYVRDAAERHLDMGLSSCYLYWLSNWPWWHPELVERGAQQLIKAIRTLEMPVDLKQQAEKAHKDLLASVWDYHWSGAVEEDYKAFEKERNYLLSLLPRLD